MKMIDRITAMQKRNDDLKGDSGNTSFNNNEKIFFDFTEGDHKIRLVGEWVTIRNHWVFPGAYSRVKLFDETAFNGENAIKKNIVCSDFDTHTETVNNNKTCTICKLHAAASEILYNTRDLNLEQKELLSNIVHDTNPVERSFFLCIDRDNPEIAPGKKGLKIVEFPKALMEQWTALVMQNKDLDVCGDETGIDFIVSKRKEGKKYKYSVNYVMNGVTVAVTPLTDEEKEYTKHDIRKIMGKLPDQNLIMNNLRAEFKEIITDAEDASGDSGSELVPF